jgi:hypothetical protein
MPPPKLPANGGPYCLQIPAWRDLVTRCLTRDASRQEEQARQDGVPHTVETEVAFLRAAAKEISDYNTTGE